jgi:hypothetical protein
VAEQYIFHSRVWLLLSRLQPHHSEFYSLRCRYPPTCSAPTTLSYLSNGVLQPNVVPSAPPWYSCHAPTNPVVLAQRFIVCIDRRIQVLFRPPLIQYLRAAHLRTLSHLSSSPTSFPTVAQSQSSVVPSVPSLVCSSIAPVMKLRLTSNWLIAVAQQFIVYALRRTIAVECGSVSQ